MSTQQISAEEMKSPAVAEKPCEVDDELRVEDERGDPEAHRTSVSTKKIVALIACLLVAIAAGILIYRALLYEGTDDAQVQGHIMPLSARVSGQILKVECEQGQIVHAGDILVVIDPRDYTVARNQAAADLADAEAAAISSHLSVPITSASAFSTLDSAQAAVKNAEAGVAAAQQNLQADQAALQQAEANAARTDADLARYEQLVKKEDISQQQYDAALSSARANQAAVKTAEAIVAAAGQALQQAQGRLVQAKADLRSAQTAPKQVLLTDAKARSAEAQVALRKARLEQAQLNLDYTIIRSPVTGVVGKRTAEIGQNASVGQELIDVVPLDDIWVVANFKETQLAHMKPKQPVDIRVDAYGRKWTGHVSNLGGGTGSVFSLIPPENATGNYVKVVQRIPVRIDFDRQDRGNFNAEGLLKPGMSVEPEVKVR